MITSQTVKLGISKYSINLKSLYNSKELDQFGEKWQLFYNSDPLCKNIFTNDNAHLHYYCDHFVPIKNNKKIPLFLLFGNSTPHSIVEECYFSYEGNRNEHRLWKLLDQLDIFKSTKYTDLDLESKNKKRKDNWFSLNYTSSFKIAMDVYFSIPSTPSRPPWSGVAGIHKLFGSKAIDQISQQEDIRIKNTIEKFMPNGGYILCFQKDAYNAIISEDSLKYNLNDAISGELIGNYKYNKNNKVYGIAPTRWLNGGEARKSLFKIINEIRSI